MLEASVLTIDENGEPVVPYYSQDAIRTYVKDYLENNIKKYTKEFTVETAFIDNEQGYCVDFCREVSIKLTAKINFLYNYEKTQTFLVVGRDDL